MTRGLGVEIISDAVQKSTSSQEEEGGVAQVRVRYSGRSNNISDYYTVVALQSRNCI